MSINSKYYYEKFQQLIFYKCEIEITLKYLQSIKKFLIEFTVIIIIQHILIKFTLKKDYNN